MEKNSIAAKIERIRRAMEAGEFTAALEIAKTIDAVRLKSAADLSVLAEAYYRNSDFETALLYFEQIYQKTKTRRILINLINLCLKLSMADMAESYLRDFTDMAPQDFYRHIFRYRIDKLRGEELDILIFDLELLKNENYMEDWAYELAKLYHKSGQREKCVAECDDIILWFGSGVCVDRARALRAYYLSGQPNSLSEKDAALAQEVRRLVTAGRTAEEVENFIEETTTGTGNQAGYSEEEYRNERYGKPVYEEEGKDVVWETKEFGPVTEKTVQVQNTMDLLQGMQVAQQIRMALGENQEFVIEQPEEPMEEEPMPEEPVEEEPTPEESESVQPERQEEEDAAEATLLEEEPDLELSQSVPGEEYEYPAEVVLHYFPEEGTELAQLLQERDLSMNDFFTGFLTNVTVRKQLLRSMEQMFDSRNKNVCLIITGEEKSGKTVLGKAIAKTLQALGVMPSPRVAIIQAEKLNRISLQDKKSQLVNTTLIIERAGDLSAERTEELLALKSEFFGTTAVILEDERMRLNQLLRDQPELSGQYSNRIHLPKWTAEDLYLQMLSRFVSAEYGIEKEVAVRLKEHVRNTMKDSGAEVYGEMMAYTEEIMSRAEKRMAAELKQFAIEGRYREANLMLVRLEDL